MLCRHLPCGKCSPWPAAHFAVLQGWHGIYSAGGVSTCSTKSYTICTWYLPHKAWMWDSALFLAVGDYPQHFVPFSRCYQTPQCICERLYTSGSELPGSLRATSLPRSHTHQCGPHGWEGRALQMPHINTKHPVFWDATNTGQTTPWPRSKRAACANKHIKSELSKWRTREALPFLSRYSQKDSLKLRQKGGNSARQVLHQKMKMSRKSLSAVVNSAKRSLHI